MLCASYHVRNQSLIYAFPFLVMQSNLAASFKTKIKLFIVSLAVLVFSFNNQMTTLWNSSKTTDQGGGVPSATDNVLLQCLCLSFLVPAPLNLLGLFFRHR